MKVFGYFDSFCGGRGPQKFSGPPHSYLENPQQKDTLEFNLPFTMPAYDSLHFPDWALGRCIHFSHFQQSSNSYLQLSAVFFNTIFLCPHLPQTFLDSPCTLISMDLIWQPYWKRSIFGFILRHWFYTSVSVQIENSVRDLISY